MGNVSGLGDWAGSAIQWLPRVWEIQLLAQDAQRLCPRGVPKYGAAFQPAYGTGREDYGDSLTKIFCRVSPTPLPNRYFSIERARCVLDSMVRSAFYWIWPQPAWP